MLPFLITLHYISIISFFKFCWIMHLYFFIHYSLTSVLIFRIMHTFRLWRSLRSSSPTIYLARPSLDVLPFLMAFTFCTKNMQIKLFKSLSFAVIQASGSGLIFILPDMPINFSCLRVFTSDVLATLAQSYPYVSNCCSGCHSKE